MAHIPLLSTGIACKIALATDPAWLYKTLGGGWREEDAGLLAPEDL